LGGVAALPAAPAIAEDCADEAGSGSAQASAEDHGGHAELSAELGEDVPFGGGSDSDSGGSDFGGAGGDAGDADPLDADAEELDMEWMFPLGEGPPHHPDAPSLDGTEESDADDDVPPDVPGWEVRARVHLDCSRSHALSLVVSLYVRRMNRLMEMATRWS
jgi:hypothetical protein